MRKQHKRAIKFSAVSWSIAIALIGVISTADHINDLEERIRTEEKKYSDLKDVLSDSVKELGDANTKHKDAESLIEALKDKISDRDGTIKELESSNKDILSLLKPLKKQNPTYYLELYKSLSVGLTMPYSTTEFDLICRVVEAEIGGGDWQSKLNVASVIFNRYKSGRYPKNMKEILFQNTDGDYQFTSVENGMYMRREPSKNTIQAVEFAWYFGDTTNGATYFHSNVSQGKWHSRAVAEGKLSVTTHDNYHTFYKIK